MSKSNVVVSIVAGAKDQPVEHRGPSFRTIDVPQIEAHPKNPRHKATPDEELVASVKEFGLVQPLIVAPIPLPEPAPGMGVRMERYVLIAGHRRLAALKKARIKVAPCVVRHDLDTDTKQLEAMLLENSSRVDLSPIEEAEGYEQLTLLGYKQGQIAKLTGRAPKTISARLRLLKLAKTTQNKVHAGQLTIDDAAAFVEFADDPAITKKLEKAATGQGNGLKYEIETQRRVRKNNTETAALEAELTSRGVPALEIPEGKTLRDLDVRNLWSPSEEDLARHDGCLAWMVEETTYSGQALRYYCTDHAKHTTAADDERSEAQRQRDEQWEIARAEAAERTARQNTAEELRLAILLAAVLAACLPGVVRELVHADGNEPYQRLAQIPETTRWGNRLWDDKSADYRSLVDHLEDIPDYGNADLVKTLVVALFMYAENGFTSGEKAVGKPYAELLAAAEHEWCDIDLDYREALEAPADVESEVSA